MARAWLLPRAGQAETASEGLALAWGDVVVHAVFARHASVVGACLGFGGAPPEPATTEVYAVGPWGWARVVYAAARRLVGWLVGGCAAGADYYLDGL